VSISGSLATMPVTELFQWVGQNRRSGVLTVISGRNSVRFLFRDGRISGCASNDPPAMLGQFLLSRGKISERMLEEALSEQERRPRTLGAILVELGALAEGELERYIAAKAEETIYKLFEWDDADFTFRTEFKQETAMISVDLSVDDVLLRGAQRADELRRMREVFDNPGLVLCHTDHELNPETAGTPMARRLYDLIDGKRTFGQILLASRASEFLATRFLYQLYKRGIIAIRDVHEVAPGAGTAERACEVATELLDKGEYDAALETLLTCQSNHPRNELLERTLTRVEGAYLEHAYQVYLPPTKRPSPVPERRRGATPPLSSNELFLLDLIADGRRDVKAIVQVAPLHEIDTIRGLKKLLDRHRIVLHEGASPAPVQLPEFASLESDSEPVEELDLDVEHTIDGILRTVRD